MAGLVWVSGYYRKDGTYVKGYYKTAPDSTKNNNFSTVGNTNPFTGEAGTKPGGSNSISAGSSTNTNYTGNPTGSSGGTSTPPDLLSGGNPTAVTKTLPGGISTTVVYWDEFLVTNMSSNGSTKFIKSKEYSGPVNSLEKEIIGDSSSQIIYGTPANDFINGSGGDDAIDAGPGDDVLDGGTGSNFLTGGSGTDTFFIDGRTGGITWSTVTDLEHGEWITAWGWKEGVSKLTWQEMNGTGSFTGATARIDLDGNGSIDMSLTITGKASGAIITLPGQVDGNGYLAFTLS
ncbi:hypothetical protein [Azospirillum formosense]|uniref:calcium-binding protein n=1 Tax=Azospirillum formosense TaxID=861533 RepID=UPI00338EB35D